METQSNNEEIQNKPVNRTHGILGCAFGLLVAFACLVMSILLAQMDGINNSDASVIYLILTILFLVPSALGLRIILLKNITTSQRKIKQTTVNDLAKSFGLWALGLPVGTFIALRFYIYSETPEITPIMEAFAIWASVGVGVGISVGFLITYVSFIGSMISFYKSKK